ncbi:MAG TPA: DUF3857 domain-containing protein [Terriglobales bacterium]|nr:DUF3857 domain-containing protein [Terriglobales bacterium]
MIRPFGQALLCVLLFSNFPVFGADRAAPRFTLSAKDIHEQASRATPPDGADASVLTDDETYVFDAQGRSTYTEYLVYKVLSQKGVEGWDGISVNWEPWHQERPSIKARVITPDYVVHELDPKTVTDAPAQEEDSDIYSDARVMRTPLPAIAPGSVVEQEITVRENASLFAAGTVARSFWGRVSIPVQHSSLTLQAPSALPLRHITQLLPDLQPQKTEKDGTVTLMFEHGPMQPLDEAEENLPSDVPAYPAVAFSTGNSWQQVASEYAKTVDERVKAADVKAVVDKLIAGKDARNDKMQAILDYVNKNIRYTGVEFGSASIIPHAPSETLAHRYGDCKDKSTLVVAMLRAADIPAYLTLLNAGGRLDVPSDLPGMGLFDHAIVFVPGPPEVWIDATDEYARVGQLPNADQGRFALVVRRDTTALVRTFESSSRDNVLLESREIYLAENGSARIVETSRPKGVFEAEYRDAYADKQNKKTKDNLSDYVKSQYLAEKLDRLDRSDPQNLHQQFELVLESQKAKRGFTDLDNAAAAIRLEGLFDRLPDDLKKRADEEDKKQDDGKPKKKRTAEYQLREPFVAEWDYKIVPPLGFQAKVLPKNASLTLGPAVLTETFEQLKDGSVSGVLRFDTVKRRYTVSEVKELQNRVAELSESEAILVNFEPTARVLRDQGKLRESFQAYRSLITQHPTEALHHLQIAKALLDAGLGDAARQEARTAVKLDPKSALAQKTFAEILEYDLVGRKFRPGSDYAGAAAAYREAVKLDPADKETLGNLAILLEYNQFGMRYGAGAPLKDAVAVYRQLGAEKLASVGLRNNLAFALFYAAEFSDARKDAETLNPRPKGLIIACGAVLDGSQSALAEANKLSNDDNELKDNLKAAGNMLIFMRKYKAAADLLEAGASGENAATTAALASRLHNMQLHEDVQFGKTPEEAVKQFFFAALQPDLTADKLKAMSSKNAVQVINESDSEELKKSLQTGKDMERRLARHGTSLDVTIDLLLQMIDSKVEGDDASGYRENIHVPNAPQMTLYVVKEDGRYKILDSSQKPNALALEVLDRIAANNVAGAAILLNWVRDEQHIGGGDDPLAGPAFPRFWTKGKTNDPQQMKLAAAALLVQSEETAKQGVALLEQAKASSAQSADNTNINLALMTAYGVLRDYSKQLSITMELGRQYPESRTVFLTRSLALRALDKSIEADRLADDRLKTIPDDLDAMRAKYFNAIARRDYPLAYERTKLIADAGKAEANDLNELAWDSLFFDRKGGSDLDSALKASQLSQNSAAVLHTLGCVYAELGQTKQAREVLLQAMDVLGLDQPDSNYWYAFARIAEQYGENEIANAYYAKVEKPKLALNLPNSTYELAQIRVKALKASSGKLSAAK